MIILLCIALVITVIAIVVVVHAIDSAPEGYEDATGFHVLSESSSKPKLKKRGRSVQVVGERESELPGMLPSR